MTDRFIARHYESILRDFPPDMRRDFVFIDATESVAYFYEGIERDVFDEAREYPRSACPSVFTWVEARAPALWVGGGGEQHIGHGLAARMFGWCALRIDVPDDERAPNRLPKHFMELLGIQEHIDLGGAIPAIFQSTRQYSETHDGRCVSCADTFDLFDVEGRLIPAPRSYRIIDATLRELAKRDSAQVVQEIANVHLPFAFAVNGWNSYERPLDQPALTPCADEIRGVRFQKLAINP